MSDKKENNGVPHDVPSWLTGSTSNTTPQNTSKSTSSTPNMGQAGNKILPENEINSETDEGEEFSIRIKTAFSNFWEKIVDFEDRHPWVFFTSIAIGIFVVITLVASPFVSRIFLESNSEPQNTPTPEIQNTAPKNQGTKESTTSIKFSGPHAASLGIQLANRQIYIDILPKSWETIVSEISNKTFLSAELIALKQTDEILSIDIQASLKDAQNQAATLDAYLSQLTTLANRSDTYFTNLSHTYQALTQEKDSLTKTQQENKTTLNNVLLNGSNEETAKALQTYVETAQRLSEIQNTSTLIKEVINASQNPLLNLRARIAGIKANKSAILNGISIVEIDRSGLNLIKEGKIEDYL